MDDQIEVHRPLSRTDTAVTRARKRNRWVSPLIGLIILGGVGYTGWRLFLAPHEQAARTRGAPPQPVGVATIANGNVSVVLTGLGAVTPLATVTVKTQINGQLQQIAFTEGQMVHKGDFLAQIDPRPYQVALEQAQGTLAKDTALLGQARADLVRYNTLGRQDSIAKQQVEDQAYLVKQDEGTVLNDQAAVDSAKLNLVYCHIVSPVDGKVGIRMVDQGNYVQTSDTNGLVVITQLQPMSVLFTLPEDDVAELQKQFGDHKVAVTAYDRTDTKQIAVGSLATLDNQIDPTTGTVKLRAMFDNTDNALFPQQFVNARLLLNTLENVVVAPQAAIQHGAPGDFVYVVEPGGTVHLQVVKLGVTQGNTVQILEGLKAGDTVVTDGLDRLREGARVTVAAPAGATPAGRPGGGPAGGRRGSRNGTAPANEAEPASPNAAGTSGPTGAATSGPNGAATSGPNGAGAK